MASRVEVDDSWHEEVGAAVRELFEQRLGPDISEDARRYCPKRTGRLAESIKFDVEDSTLIVSATGDGTEQYAAYVELGTRPHEIRPRGRGALFWAGAMHPVGVVHHPGTRAQPFLRPALYRERGD